MATPTDPRDYEAYLRGPLGLNTFRLCTNNTPNAYRGGVQHDPRLSIFPEPADEGPDDFGIVTGGSFTVEIADEDRAGGIDGLGPDWFLMLEDGSGNLVLDDGSGRLVQEY